MSELLSVSASLVNEKVKFKATAKDNPEIIVDYTPPIGDAQGYTSLELMLISLATCCGTSVCALLRKMAKDVSDLRIVATGNRRQQHPTYFETIHLQIHLRSANAEAADLGKALRISEETICPVWNMMKNTVQISYEYAVAAID